MIKFLKDCQCPRNMTVDCGDPSCCQWQEYDGIYDYFEGDTVFESEVILDNLEEYVDYEIID